MYVVIRNTGRRYRQGVAVERDLMSFAHDPHTDPIPSAQPIYAAAALWRNRCLLDDLGL